MRPNDVPALPAVVCPLAVPVDDGGRHLGPCLPRAGVDPRQVDAVTVGDGGIVRNHEHLSAVGGQVTPHLSLIHI